MILSEVDLINVARTRLGSASQSTVSQQVVSIQLDIDTKNYLGTNKKFANVVFNIVNVNGVDTWAYEGYALSDTRSVPVLLNLPTLAILYDEWRSQGNNGAFIDFLNSLQGNQGFTGWTPILSQVPLTGGKVVVRLTSFVGGEGTLPSELQDKIGKYQKADGTFTSNVNEAQDIAAELKAIVEQNTEAVEGLAAEADADRVAAESARVAAQAARDIATTKASEAAASAATAANVTNTNQINDIDQTAYIIEDGDGKIALKIFKDGTIEGKFDISKIKILFDNMPDLVKNSTPESTDSVFVDKAYVIVDNQGKVAFAINKEGKIEGKFDLSQTQILYNNLSADLQAGLAQNVSSAEWTGYLYAIVDTEGKVAFAINNEGKVIASIQLAAKSVTKGMLSDEVTASLPSDEFLRINQFNTRDTVTSVDDELFRAKEVEVPQKTLTVGILFNKMPYLACSGLRGKNDTGTDIEVRKETGLVVRGKRNRSNYAPALTSANLVTYKGWFRSDASGLPSSPVLGDFYLVVMAFNVSQTQTLFGVSMTHWDTLYWNGSSWLTNSFPFTSAVDDDFRTVTAVGKFWNISLAVNDRLVYLGVKTGGGWNEPILVKQKTGEYYCMGECNPASFSPSNILDGDLYVVSADGTFDGLSLKRGDYLLRNNGAWGVSKSETTTILSGKTFDLACNNANQLGIRRADLGASVVSFRPKTNISVLPRRASKDFVLYSDSMFGVNVGAAIVAILSGRVTSVESYGGAGSNNVLSMVRANILSNDAYRGRTHVFWHGQNNNTDTVQIKSAALEMARLAGVSDGRFVFWSVLGQQIMTWNGTRMVDTNHENAFNRIAGSQFIEVEDWYDTIMPNKHFNTRKAALAAADGTKSLHFPTMSERQVADTYGITPSSFHFNYADKPFTAAQLNFVGYQSAAGLPTGGNDNDYYLRTGNGTVGQPIVKVAGVWIEYSYDVTHVTAFGGQKLAEQFLIFLNNNKF